MRAFQKSINKFFIGQWIGIADKYIDFFRCGWQANQIGVKPADERDAVGFRGRFQAVTVKPSQNECVDRITNPLRPFDAPERRPNRRDKCPVRPILSSLNDPPFEKFFLVY